MRPLVLEQIRKIESGTGRHVPIVAMTAAADDGRSPEVPGGPGMDDYLSKPVSVSQLKQTLERWLNPPAPPTQPVDESVRK